MAVIGQFTQYKMYGEDFTNYVFIINSVITLFPWQLRILFGRNRIEQYMRNCIEEIEEMLHPSLVLSQNQSFISLLHVLRKQSDNNSNV